MLKRDILKICEKFISVSDISAVIIYLFIYQLRMQFLTFSLFLFFYMYFVYDFMIDK